MGITKIKLSLIAFMLSLTFFNLSLAVAGGPEMSSPLHGFYLTADIGGVTFYPITSLASTASFPTLGVNVNQLTDINARNALSFTWGAGIGWMFNSLFRMDATYIFLKIPLDFHSIVVSSTAASPTTFSTGNISSEVYFLNCYINLAALFGHRTAWIEPYVGGGIGVANNRLRDITQNTNSVGTVSTLIEPSSRTDFAYQVIFGVSYHLITQLLLNAQYSFMDMGKYVIGPGITPPSGSLTSNPRFHAQSSRFSIGLIYVF